LHLPASIGYPHDLVSSLDKVSDPAFTTAVGLVCWGNQLLGKAGGGNRFSSSFGSIDQALGGLTKIFKSLLP